jgi:hypothetical protein
MKQILFLAAVVFLAITLCAPAMKQFYPGNYFPEDHTYQNKALGFSLTYRGNWDITTDPNDMKDNKSYAKELHESGAELLLIGFTVENTQGTRCIATNLNEPANEYADEIRRLNKDQVDSDSGCTNDTLNGMPMVVWRYAKDDFRFIEYFFNIETYDIRVAFWTKPRLFDKFLPVYKGIMGTLSVTGR